MKTLILCGGKGTRAYPHTLEVPKPLLEVASRPMLRHVMDIFAAQGHNEFVLAAGFKHELVEAFARQLPATWDVEVVDTGEETETGARCEMCRPHVGETFFLTYGDGVGDVDLADLLDFHRSHSGHATITTVPLRSQYGTIECRPDGLVERFAEKPVLSEHWINAGFLVVDQAAFDLWVGTDLEREVLPSLGGAGVLYAYRHSGFWRSMDTYKDALELTALCARSDQDPDCRPPWLSFVTHASS